MRKIEEEMIQAVKSRTIWSKDNTMVIIDNDLLSVWLHGNKIAWETTQGDYISLCGWNTVTTRSRLNALRGVMGSDLYQGVYQKDFICYVRYGQINPVLNYSFCIG